MKIKIDNIWYHARETYDINTKKTNGLELILDENDNPIESSICICSAFNKFECCCGAWDQTIDDNSDIYWD